MNSSGWGGEVVGGEGGEGGRGGKQAARKGKVWNAAQLGKGGFKDDRE